MPILRRSMSPQVLVGDAVVLLVMPFFEVICKGMCDSPNESRGYANFHDVKFSWHWVQRELQICNLFFITRSQAKIIRRHQPSYGVTAISRPFHLKSYNPEHILNKSSVIKKGNSTNIKMQLSTVIFSTILLSGSALAVPGQLVQRSSLSFFNGEKSILAEMEDDSITTRDILQTRKEGEIDCKGSAFCEKLGSSCDDAYRKVVASNTYSTYLEWVLLIVFAHCARLCRDCI